MTQRIDETGVTIAERAGTATPFEPEVSYDFERIQAALDNHGGVADRDVLIISDGVGIQGRSAGNYALELEDRGASRARVLLTQASDQLIESQNASGLDRQPDIQAHYIGEHGGVSLSFEAERATRFGGSYVWNSLDQTERNSAGVVVINDLPPGSYGSDAEHSRESFLNRVLRVAEPGATVVIRSGGLSQDFSKQDCTRCIYDRVKDGDNGQDIYEQKWLEVVEDQNSSWSGGGHVIVATVGHRETPLKDL